MNIKQTVLASSLLILTSTAAIAKPMPNSITVDDKAVVPVVKTQIIRRVEGEQPIRTVEATILEVSNKGQDIVSRDVVLQDNQENFSEKQMSNPVIKEGSLIVPISKTELTTTVTQDGVVVGETKTVDAMGVEIKKDGEVVKRELQLEQLKNTEAKEKVTHAVATENGVTTRDVVVFGEAE